ncbi:hypothetical protein BJ741DRAFT_327694 [Chytriomyces cf. hyalinus JEL632]|nr:hypothetical protein BJ741DRAFT_327694 [Chytriomyces cf. hyalinus JEL632]
MFVSLEDDANKKKNVFSAWESMDDIDQPLKVLKIEVKALDGVPDLLYSHEIYEDEASIGLNMPVDELLKIAKRTIILIGVSGCGKTRTCYDYARHHWCLYFDCAKDSDVQAMIGLLKTKNPPIKNDYTQNVFEVYSETMINALIATRLLVLKILRKQSNVDPFGWHCMQRSGRSRLVFEQIFSELISYSGNLVSQIFLRLKSEFDGRVIFDESQQLLDILTADYRSSKSDLQGISRNKLKFPRSLFSFATRHIIKHQLKSIWCGTHMRIRNVDLIYSAAGKKPTDVHIFTNFSYLKPAVILKLCSKWIRKDIIDSQETLFLEISNFLQGRPRFFTSFLHELLNTSDVREAFQSYCRLVTTRAGSSAEVESADNKFSLYDFWAQRISWSIEPIVNENDPFSRRLVSNTLLELCVTSLFGNRTRKNIRAEMDLVSTCLVMVQLERDEWQAFMTEPMVLGAGMNFLADQHPHALLEHFASSFFAPVEAPAMSPAERGHHMELIIAIRFLQGWWLEAGLKELLPKWVHKLEIPRPVGFMDCRFKSGDVNIFLRQLQEPDFPWVICPPSNAGPDLRYSVFSCHVKTTSTPRSKSSMFVTATQCKKNIATMDPDNWYKYQDDVRKKCLLAVKKNKSRFVHMRFELPDSAPSLKEGFKSGAVRDDYVICVNLESEFAKLFFGTRFVAAYKEFVREVISTHK